MDKLYFFCFTTLITVYITCFAGTATSDVFCVIPVDELLNNSLSLAVDHPADFCLSAGDETIPSVFVPAVEK